MIVECAFCGYKIDINERVEKMIERYSAYDNVLFHPSYFYCPRCKCPECIVIEE